MLTHESNVGILHGIISMSEVTMVKFINKSTGGVMWVADERAAEYKAAGYKVADAPKPVEKPAEKPKRKPSKKG